MKLCCTVVPLKSSLMLLILPKLPVPGVASIPSSLIETSLPSTPPTMSAACRGILTLVPSSTGTMSARLCEIAVSRSSTRTTEPFVDAQSTAPALPAAASASMLVIFKSLATFSDLIVATAEVAA